MFKVLIWDFTGISSQWLEQVADTKVIEVVDTITPDKPAPEILLKTNAWDWLLIFERGARQIFDATIQTLRLPLDKVIYALDMNSWLQRPKAAFTLTDMFRGGGDIFLNLNFEMSRQLNDFVTCTIEGLSYVATSKDNIIMRDMYTRRLNWAVNDMKTFHALVQKFYGVDDSAGYFLDLGANIGTTGIYFTKKIAPNLKLFAVEPESENFKLLRTNLILNDMSDDKATLVNCGLGNKFDEMTIHRNLSNPGGNSFIPYKDNTPSGTVKIAPLDVCLAEKQIAASDVKYVWIDTEGFEPQVLLGAKNLLRQNPVPIFMECNLGSWKKSGYFDDMINLLAESYSHFIHVQSGNEIYPLETLRTMEISFDKIGQFGDIFLIKHGAIV